MFFDMLIYAQLAGCDLNDRLVFLGEGFEVKQK